MLEKSIPIVKAAQIKERVDREFDVEVSVPKVRQILKQGMGLGYRRTKKVPIQANSERCLVLRQQYALEMLRLLMRGKRVINVDESWLNETSFTRMMWSPATAAGTITQ